MHEHDLEEKQNASDHHPGARIRRANLLVCFNADCQRICDHNQVDIYGNSTAEHRGSHTLHLQ
jgi:hypothetical protein